MLQALDQMVQYNDHHNEHDHHACHCLTTTFKTAKCPNRAKTHNCVKRAHRYVVGYVN